MKQRNVVKNITVVAVFMLMAMLVGCFGGGPSNAEIEKTMITNMHADGSDKLRTIINFNVIEKKKTDDSHYTAKVSYDQQFMISFADFRSEVMAEARAANGPDKLNAVMMVTAIKESFGDFKKDDLFHQEEEVIFAKTDKGWKMTTATN